MSDTTNEVQLVERAEAESSPAVEEALQITVMDQGSFDEASSMLQQLKKAKSVVVDIFADPKRTALAAHRSVVAAEKRVLEPLDKADRHLRMGVSTYSQKLEQERLAVEREERKRLEAEAEAERARQFEEALADDNEEEAEAILEAPTASFEPPPLPAKTKPPTGPVGTQTRWKGECIDLMALVRAVAVKDAPLELLKVDQAALNSYATFKKEDAKLPGVRFNPVTSTVVR